MNILSFINSQSGANHLKKIGYEFSTLESVYAVCTNHTKPLKNRLAALSEIMETMPDCFMPDPDNTNNKKLLFPFLKQYIQLQQTFLDDFYAEGNGVYSFAYICNDGRYEFVKDCVYRNFDSCIKEAINNYGGHSVIRIEKKWFDIPRSIAIVFTEEKEIMEILPLGLSLEEFEINDFFNVLELKFPVPFRKGDILTYKYSLSDGVSPPLVFDDGDCRTAGKMLDFNENLSTFPISNYLNLEYCNKEIVGNERILKAYAEYTKGNWNLLKYQQAVEFIKHDTKRHEEVCIYVEDDIRNFFGIWDDKKD